MMNLIGNTMVQNSKISRSLWWGVALFLITGFLYSAKAQMIYTIAGTGMPGYSGDGGSAVSAQFRSGHISCDTAGRLFLSDVYEHRIRYIDNQRIINTYAGTGILGFSGDGLPSTIAQLHRPQSITIDSSGNLYIADVDNWRIRKVSSSGIISTVTGDGTIAYMGDGGPATMAKVSLLGGLATDLAGNLFFVDRWNVRKIDVSGIITTIAGNSTFGFSGDGGSATMASFNFTGGSLAIDAFGNLYVLDNLNHRIRKIGVSGIVTTIAGSGPIGSGAGSFSGDGGPATNARLNAPSSIAIDHNRSLYIMDNNNHRIRKIDTNGIITTIAGTGTGGYAGDGGAATAAEINYGKLATDCAGNLFINDSNRVRIITFGTSPAFTGGGMRSITVCKDAPAFPIDSLVAISMGVVGRTETWSLASLPSHGTALASYSIVSTGSVLTPSGLSYTPAIGYSGYDTFRVQVSDCGYIKDTVTFYVTVSDCSLGTTTQYTTRDGLQIYPIPVNKELLINSTKGKYTSLIITNTIGQQMLRQPLTPPLTTVDVGELPTGLYYITLSGVEGNVVKKFIKR